MGDGRRGSQYASAILPKSKLALYIFMFVWNLGLSVEEAVFYLGVSTLTVERYVPRHQYLHKTHPPLFIPRGSTHTVQGVNLYLGSMV